MKEWPLSWTKQGPDGSDYSPPLVDGIWLWIYIYMCSMIPIYTMFHLLAGDYNRRNLKPLTLDKFALRRIRMLPEGTHMASLCSMFLIHISNSPHLGHDISDCRSRLVRKLSPIMVVSIFFSVREGTVVACVKKHGLQVSEASALFF